jgi:hypothetical protein
LKMLYRHLMERSSQRPLEQGERGFHSVRINVTFHVLGRLCLIVLWRTWRNCVILKL